MKKNISASLEKNLQDLQTEFDNSADLMIRRMQVCGVPAALVSMEGLVNKLNIAESILNPILQAELEEKNPVKLFSLLETRILSTTDHNTFTDQEELMTFLLNGFAIFLLDGCGKALAAGVQGYAYRSIAEPQNENSQKGSRESFVEPFLINMSMIRRRIRDPRLKFERLAVGKRSRTNLLLCYVRDVAAKELVDGIREKLLQADMETVMGSGYIAPFVSKQESGFFFVGAGRSERPDTVCGKLVEGRVAVIIDGTPSVLVLPRLFVENFQTFDDYVNRPFYAFFTRILKYIAFFLSLFFPGFYVATAAFHPELLPQPLLIKIAQSEVSTPFPLMLELLLIHIIYEIMREAGLRAPKPLGHAVSIVGALVIGDMAVSSGLVGPPTLMVVAVTATAAYVTPSLYEISSVIRLVMIFVGGWLGFWGLMLGVFLVLVNICSETVYGIPFSAPVSPFSWKSMRDVFWRSSWKRLGRRDARIQDLPGSKLFSGEKQKESSENRK